LVIFLRPLVIREPSIDRDLKDFRPFLEQALSRRSVEDGHGEATP
jgi:hypothetical protein